MVGWAKVGSAKVGCVGGCGTWVGRRAGGSWVGGVIVASGIGGRISWWVGPVRARLRPWACWDLLKRFIVAFSCLGSPLDVHREWAMLRATGGLSPGWCSRHKAYCERRRASPDMDISGSPCQSWSTMGLRQGSTSLLTVLFLAWALWARAACPLLIIHENVKGFDTSMLELVLGDLYDITRLDVRPTHSGFHAVRRPRSYCLLFRRARVRMLRDVSKLYRDAATMLGGLSPEQHISELFIAEGVDLMKEENRLRALKHLALPPVERASTDWTYLLTEKQRMYLATYMAAVPIDCKLDDCIFDLSQNPGRRRGRWTSDGTLPTVTTVSRLWVPSLRRFLLPVELAYAHGFPVTSTAAVDAGVAQDMVPYTRHQIGNCMHLASVGIVLAVAAASVSRASE